MTPHKFVALRTRTMTVECQKGEYLNIVYRDIQVLMSKVIKDLLDRRS